MVFTVVTFHFPVELNNLDCPSQMSVDQGNATYMLAQIERSLLWSHGGHPYLPSSAKSYDLQRQLFLFCESVWPGKRKLWERGESFKLRCIALS